jgi:hypothetical protein
VAGGGFCAGVGLTAVAGAVVLVTLAATIGAEVGEEVFDADWQAARQRTIASMDDPDRFFASTDIGFLIRRDR